MATLEFNVRLTEVPAVAEMIKAATVVLPDRPVPDDIKDDEPVTLFVTAGELRRFVAAMDALRKLGGR